MDRPSLCFPFLKDDLDGPNLRKSSIDRYWDRPGLYFLLRNWFHASRSFFWAYLFASFLGFIPASLAETTPSPELEGVLRKIESRHYRWIAIRADVLLFFAKAGDPNAMCGGELLYQRLDERMFLTCVDAKQELLFVFRTSDRRFDLYLPAQNKVYHGSIFDMEDSPDIESHLKARDLYRALKPTAVDPRRTKIERTNSAITSLDVYGRNDSENTRVRKLYLTPEGDVRGELFYDPKGRPVTEIQRYDFRKLRGHSGLYDSVIFPKKITILSPETKRGSAIFFTNVTPLDTADPLEFVLRVPPGTQEIFLDEKDPSFQRSKTLESEVRLTSKAKHFAPSTPEKDLKKAGTAPLSPKNLRVAPELEEKHVKEILPAFSTEKPAELEKHSSQGESAKLPAKATPPEDPDADIAPEGPPPTETSTANPRTTLDPSVQPSLEMDHS